MLAFALYLIPETGEPSMTIISALNTDDAKAQAVAAMKSGGLRTIRLWNGERMIELARPVRLRSAKPIDDEETRGARMIAMKRAGKTQRQIAEAFDISVDRVRLLVARIESRDRMLATQPNRASLSVRAQGVLPSLIDEPEVDRSERDRLLPNRVATLTRAQILDVPNAGLRTIAEIETWLWERGLFLNG